jgi:hypothetical protein
VRQVGHLQERKLKLCAVHFVRHDEYKHMFAILDTRYLRFYKFRGFCSCKVTDTYVEDICRKRPRNVWEFLKFLVFGGFRENMRAVQQLSQEYRHRNTLTGALNLAPSASETTNKPTPSFRDESTAQDMPHNTHFTGSDFHTIRRNLVV